MRIKYKILILTLSILLICSLLQSFIFQSFFYSDKTEDAINKFKKLAVTISLAQKNMKEKKFSSFCKSLLNISDKTGTAKLISLIVYYEGKSDEPIACFVDWDHFDINSSSSITALDVVKQLKKDFKTNKNISIVKTKFESDRIIIIELGLDLIKHFKQKNNIYYICLIIIIIGFVLGFFGSSYFVKTLSNPIEILAHKIVQVGKGNLDISVNIKTNDEIGILANSFNKMTAGLKEREFYKNTLQRYVSKQVADKIMQNKESMILKGENRFATIMFTDIRGFTPLSEKYSPEEIVDILNSYFNIMVEIIFKYNGTLDKFIGDAIMAYWGAPFSQENDALNAVSAALEMKYHIEKMNLDREKNGKEPIYMGIGLNSGNVIAGNIGSVKRMEYTVIGDDVNIAQRIESQSRSNVLISHKTYELIKEHIQVEEIEPLKLKGKSMLVRTYKVLKVLKKG